MIASRPASPTRISLALVLWALLLCLPLWWAPSGALAQQPAAQPVAEPEQPVAEPEQPVAEPAQPQPQIESGTYLSLIWMTVVTASILVWLYGTGWVYKDATVCAMNSKLWVAIMFGVGFFGLLVTILAHAAFSFLLLASLGGAFAIYVRQRNRVVPEQSKIFVKKAEAPAGQVAVQEQEGKEEEEPARMEIGLLNEAGESMEEFVAGHPELLEAAEVFGDLIGRASLVRARSIWVKPRGVECPVRFNLDGVRQKVQSLTPELGRAVISCADRFAGQSGKSGAGGRMTAILAGGERVEVVARAAKSKRGPKLVVTLPDWTEDIYRGGLTALGMHSRMAEKVGEALERDGCVIIVSGPPRSGRTSTLHAMISRIDIFTTDIFTLEHKIEHELEQVVRREVKMGSDEAFRETFEGILREEPHVIAVDELKTTQQAAPLFDFAAAGGRVLATMQADSTGQGVERLLQGVDAGIVSRTLLCVLNQRLLRKLCDQCKEPMEPNRQILKSLQISPQHQGTWFRPVGCEQCSNTGYHGRTGVFELLLVNDQVREVIGSGSASAEAIKNAAGKTALRTLLSEAVLKVVQGITTMEEVQRVF